MSEASSLHYVHNTLSSPEDKERVSALQLAMLAPFNFRVLLFTTRVLSIDDQLTASNWNEENPYMLLCSISKLGIMSTLAGSFAT